MRSQRVWVLAILPCTAAVSPVSAAPPAIYNLGTPGVDGQMIDLDAWLDANNPTEAAKRTHFHAYDISDTGRITGAGGYDPDGPGGIEAPQRAYLLDASSLVPEPSSVLTLLAAGGALLGRPRRSARRRRALYGVLAEPC